MQCVIFSLIYDFFGTVTSSYAANKLVLKVCNRRAVGTYTVQLTLRKIFVLYIHYICIHTYTLIETEGEQNYKKYNKKVQFTIKKPFI